MFKDRSPRSFLVAGAIMAVALAARALLDIKLPAIAAFITLYPVVALAGLLCGPTAGGSALVVAVAAAIYFWIPPRLCFAIHDATGCVTAALFVVASTIVLWAAALLRSELNRVAVADGVLATYSYRVDGGSDGPRWIMRAVALSARPPNGASSSLWSISPNRFASNRC
jgi:hypothetical protein